MFQNTGKHFYIENIEIVGRNIFILKRINVFLLIRGSWDEWCACKRASESVFVYVDNNFRKSYNRKMSLYIQLLVM